MKMRSFWNICSTFVCKDDLKIIMLNRKANKILKIACLLLLVPLLLAGLAIGALFLPFVQEKIKQEALAMLCDKLQTNVTIDSTSVVIRDRSVAIYGLGVDDRQGELMLHVDTLYGKVDLTDVMEGHVRIVDIEIAGAKANCYRLEKGGEANFQFLVDAFKKDTAKVEQVSGSYKKKLKLDVDSICAHSTHLIWEDRWLADSKIQAHVDDAAYHFKDKCAHVHNVDIVRQGHHVSALHIDYEDDGHSSKDVRVDSLYFKTDNGKPRKNEGKPKRGAFDAGHMDVVADVDVTIHQIGKGRMEYVVNHLSAVDLASGLQIDTLTMHVSAVKRDIAITDVYLKNQHTLITMERFDLTLPEKPELVEDTVAGRMYVEKRQYKDMKKEEMLSFRTTGFKATTQLCDIAKPFSPALANFTTPLDVTADIQGSPVDCHFRNIIVCTPDKRLQLFATGDITRMNEKREMGIIFHVNKMTAKRGIKEQIVGHFKVKQSMLGLLKKLGDVSYKGSLSIPYRKQIFNGTLGTAMGTMGVAFRLDNATHYMTGTLQSQKLSLQPIVNNENVDDVSFKVDFNFDVASRAACKRLGRKFTKLPQGWAKGVAYEAGYKKIKIHNITFVMDSDGEAVNGEIGTKGGIFNKLCTFSFTDTDFPKSLKVKPSPTFADNINPKAKAKPVIDNVVNGAAKMAKKINPFKKKDNENKN